MDKKQIPAPIIAVLTEYLPPIYNNDMLKITNVFRTANAPGEPKGYNINRPEYKIDDWLENINSESEQPLKILEKIIKKDMEIDIPSDMSVLDDFLLYTFEEASRVKFKCKLQAALTECNLDYITSGHITNSNSVVSKPFSEIVKEIAKTKNIKSLDKEFKRALKTVNEEPKEAVSAACNILEIIFKVYIEDENLKMPSDKTIMDLYQAVRDDFNFNPKQHEEMELRGILGGMSAIIHNIGALRTHASSAHGQGRNAYNLKTRHARLAVNSAHTLAHFILETWVEKSKEN